jgi:hypothetical protein
MKVAHCNTIVVMYHFGITLNSSPNVVSILDVCKKMVKFCLLEALEPRCHGYCRHGHARAN